jgi:hypothetical protein
MNRLKLKWKKMKAFLSVMILTAAIFTACSKKSDPAPVPAKEVPTVVTGTITNITGTTATGNGTVTADGGEYITKRGISWSKIPNEIFGQTFTSYANTPTLVGAFSAPMTALTPNTTYYVRAVAANKNGFGFGAEISFKTP